MVTKKMGAAVCSPVLDVYCSVLSDSLVPGDFFLDFVCYPFVEVFKAQPAYRHHLSERLPILDGHLMQLVLFHVLPDESVDVSVLCGFLTLLLHPLCQLIVDAETETCLVFCVCSLLIPSMGVCYLLLVCFHVLLRCP